jgi:hypothetical protein
MTAEELVKLIREVHTWDSRKIIRVFGEGDYSYLVKYGADDFAKKVKDERGLTIDDLLVGDIITCGATRYVVLAVEEAIKEDDVVGAYVFDGEQTAYIINNDLEYFSKTGESVVYYVNHIINTLNLKYEEDEC